jgi:ribonuclease HI
VNVVAFIDGSSLGNPGEAGCGVVLKDEEGTVLQMLGEYIGRATNNVAEYRGLLACLQLACQMGVRSLTVFSDSELMVNQMKGTYRVKQPHLKELHSQALEAIRTDSLRFTIHHIPREKNREADGLARRAIRLRSVIRE